MKIKYKPWKNLYPTIDEVSIFWVSITRLLNKNNITLGIIWAIAVYIASNVNEINEVLKALKVALDAMKVFLDKYRYILFAPTILIIFQAIKKYAQLKKHISLLQASTKYLSDSIQLNTIHVSQMSA